MEKKFTLEMACQLGVKTNDRCWNASLHKQSKTELSCPASAVKCLINSTISLIFYYSYVDMHFNANIILGLTTHII